jgi:hypothetical protein
LKVNDERAKSGSASGPGSISQRYGYHLHLVLMSLCMHEDSVLFGGEVQVGLAKSFFWIQKASQNILIPFKDETKGGK